MGKLLLNKNAKIYSYTHLSMMSSFDEGCDFQWKLSRVGKGNFATPLRRINNFDKIRD